MRKYDRFRSRLSGFALLSICVLALISCAAPRRLPAVPKDQTLAAIPAGIPNARLWVDGDPAPLIREARMAFQREYDTRKVAGQRGPLPPAVYLALSGGGDDGAFGAGLLCGWTAQGTRPEFKAVTGVSTGALIAPFAFLGPDYDSTLRAIYTTVSSKDIYEKRSLWAAISNDALADTAPMAKLMKRYVTPELLGKIAQEYQKGRLLLVATTNLDARRPNVWNMTAIAAQGGDEALSLFRKILLASSAMPAAFPPVMIDVEIAGNHYQEMHVDGGAMAQLFLYPPTLNISALQGSKMKRERRVYIIRNARLDPNWASVERRTLSIAQRAVSSLIQSQGMGDLYRVYLTTHRDNIDYNLAFIPPEFNAAHRVDFDRDYMNSLFDLAYGQARAGYKWHKTPPGYANPELAAAAALDQTKQSRTVRRPKNAQ